MCNHNNEDYPCDMCPSLFDEDKQNIKTWDCFCGNCYRTGDEFEYHLKKEHTKNDFISFHKKRAYEAVQE